MFGGEILYLYKVRQMGCDKIVRCFYEWQISNMKFAIKTKILREELDRIGLRFIWQNKQEKMRMQCTDVLRLDAAVYKDMLIQI